MWHTLIAQWFLSNRNRTVIAVINKPTSNHTDLSPRSVCLSLSFCVCVILVQLFSYVYITYSYISTDTEIPIYLCAAGFVRNYCFRLPVRIDFCYMFPYVRSYLYNETKLEQWMNGNNVFSVQQQKLIRWLPVFYVRWTRQRVSSLWQKIITLSQINNTRYKAYRLNITAVVYGVCDVLCLVKKSKKRKEIKANNYFCEHAWCQRLQYILFSLLLRIYNFFEWNAFSFIPQIRCYSNAFSEVYR